MNFIKGKIYKDKRNIEYLYLGKGKSYQIFKDNFIFFEKNTNLYIKIKNIEKCKKSGLNDFFEIFKKLRFEEFFSDLSCPKKNVQEIGDFKFSGYNKYKEPQRDLNILMDFYYFEDVDCYYIYDFNNTIKNSKNLIDFIKTHKCNI